MFIFFPLSLFSVLGVLFMTYLNPVVFNAYDLTAFSSTDVFGAFIVLFILVSTIICMIVGRKD